MLRIEKLFTTVKYMVMEAQTTFSYFLSISVQSLLEGGCSSVVDHRWHEYFAATRKLRRMGIRYKQKDGVLYDLEGKVVGIDPERIDPETLLLIER
ncbi:hypothetical protein FDP08_02200 [Marinobacter panjinensis]|uniref:Uncharacterized protein n=1 Tax=Marinobacter panjinensis TaxID=2576384 RepID=A0A4U6R116_9GAMM|nr:hypothetical protein FDP08_02200 [Marinobacter panjinensis]